MNNALSPLIIEPNTAVKTVLIMMHGLGASAHDFEGIVPFLPTQTCAMRIVLPNAPRRAVTINGGVKMPAWYDISDVAFRRADRVGIDESNALIQQLIDAQIDSGISSENIVLAGFSQGGAMALHAGLRCQQKLAGIMALSCYVLDKENHQQQISANNQSTPIWMAHGQADDVVPFSLGENSADFLSANQHSVVFNSYPMGHEVCMPEIHAIADWLSQRLMRG